MAIKLPQGFEITSKQSIDTRLVLTKAEMYSMSYAKMPDVYFCICSENKKLYIFDKTAERDPITGCFFPLENYLSFESEKAQEAFECAILGSATIEELIEKVGDAESGLVKDVSDVRAEVTEIEGNVTNLKVDVAQLEEDVQGDDGLLKRVQAAESVLSSIETRLPVAEAKLEEIEERLDALTLENIPGTLDGGSITL